MKDIFKQVCRAIKNTNTLFAIFLVFYALYFVHIDTPMFYEQTLAFFQSRNFFYFFIVAFCFGITQFMVPIAALLPLGFFLCEDTESGFLSLSLYRGSELKYAYKRLFAAMLSAVIAVLTACVLMTMILLLLSPLEGGATETWMLHRRGTALEAVMTPGTFIWYILSQYGHLAISAAIWASVAVGFSALWPNKAFVLVATFGLSLFLDAIIGKNMGDEYMLSWLQNPDLNTQMPIYMHFAWQGVYLFAALLFSCASLFVRFSTAVRRRLQPMQRWLKRHIAYDRNSSEWHLPRFLRGSFVGRIITDSRAFCTFKTLIPAAVVPLLVLSLGETVHLSTYSIGDLWMDAFRGIGWFEPAVNFFAIGKWTLVMLPPMMGIALNLDREFTERLPITLNRFSSKQAWWSSKCIASIIYALVCTCVMFFSVAVFGLLTGAQGLAIYLPDADGFMVENHMILLQLFVLLFAQILMLTQFQALIHLLSGRMQIGVLAYILPFLVCMITYSIFDRPINENIPYNWGMLMRTSILSPSYMTVDGGDPIKLCAIPYGQALLKQVIAIFIIYSFSTMIIKGINIAQREVKS